MFYDKGSYATCGNFPSVEWILVNIIITTNCTDNILWLVDSWYFKLSIDHHLWTVWPVVKNLFMLKTKCWWVFELCHSYLCHETWDLGTYQDTNDLGVSKQSTYSKTGCNKSIVGFVVPRYLRSDLIVSTYFL